jgi:hypothetical protein
MLLAGAPGLTMTAYSAQAAVQLGRHDAERDLSGAALSHVELIAGIRPCARVPVTRQG